MAEVIINGQELFYSDWVNVGDEVICLEDKIFSDGSRHKKDEVYVVKESELHYYRWHSHMYKKTM
jgi:hypothetical protein